MRRAIVIAALALGGASGTSAQDAADRIARATELSIPTSPALTLLGANPATVVRPGFAEQYKLDLIVRDQGLVPDLALALRPVWTFLFADVDAARYRNLSPVSRALSTLSLSLGTTEDEDLRRMAWSVSFSPVRRDPLLDVAFVQGISELLDVSDRQQQIAQRQATEEIRAQREIQAAGIDPNLSPEARAARIAEIAGRVERARAAFAAETRAIETELTDEVRAYVADWRQRNWNATAIDVGVGRMYEYTAASLDSLDFRGAGFGGWISAASGFGTDRLLVAALGRIQDVGGQTQTAVGGNVRYGGARFDAFVEYVFREIGAADRHEVAYGGALRLDDSRSLEFGLRTSYDSEFDLRALVPVVKLDWLIGKTRIEDLVLGAGS